MIAKNKSGKIINNRSAFKTFNQSSANKVKAINAKTMLILRNGRML